jgi:hypothetical protein
MKRSVSLAVPTCRQAALRAAILIALSGACAAHSGASMAQLPSAPSAAPVKPRPLGGVAHPPPGAKPTRASAPRILKLPARGAVPAAKTVPVTKSLPVIKNRAPLAPRAITSAPAAGSPHAPEDPLHP